MTAVALTPDHARHHTNAFGFLRLLFAALVIVAHTPELADGDRHREILTGLFGTLSFGELAVDGFFLISGYLITGSFVADRRIGAYLAKRVTRIYPGFVAASLVCLLVVAPLAGGHLPMSWGDWAGGLFRLITLKPPETGTAFSDTPYAALDGAMWTIAYEFRCYLGVIVLGLIGALGRPWLVAVLAATCLVVAVILPAPMIAAIDNSALHPGLWLGAAGEAPRLIGVFLTGSAFFLLRGRIPMNGRLAAVAAVGLVAGLFSPMLATAAVAVFGGYLILFVALGSRGPLSRINNDNDISYGVYLYAWPIGKLILWQWPGLPLWAVGGLTFVLACACGWASWLAVERPAMRWLRAAMGRRRA